MEWKFQIQDHFGVISPLREFYFLYSTWSLKVCTLRLALNQNLSSSQSGWKKFRRVCTKISCAAPAGNGGSSTNERWMGWTRLKLFFIFSSFFPPPIWGIKMLLASLIILNKIRLTILMLLLAWALFLVWLNPNSKHHLPVEGAGESPPRQSLTHQGLGNIRATSQQCP